MKKTTVKAFAAMMTTATVLSASSVAALAHEAASVEENPYGTEVSSYDEIADGTMDQLGADTPAEEAAAPVEEEQAPVKNETTEYISKEKTSKYALEPGKDYLMVEYRDWLDALISDNLGFRRESEPVRIIEAYEEEAWFGWSTKRAAKVIFLNSGGEGVIYCDNYDFYEMSGFKFFADL